MIRAAFGCGLRRARLAAWSDGTMASNLLIQKHVDVTVVTINESRLLESRELDALAAELYQLVDKMDRKKLIVDFSKVQFLASAAIGMVTALHQKSQAIKGTLVLCGFRKDIYKVFEITRLTKLLKIVPTETEAFAVFGVSP
jgi:anti-sigma B factor antagonist